MQEWKEKVINIKKPEIEKLTKRIEYLESISIDTKYYMSNNTSNALFSRHSRFLASGTKDAKRYLVELKAAYLRFYETNINDKKKLDHEFCLINHNIYMGNRSCDDADKETITLFDFQKSDTKYV